MKELCEPPINCIIGEKITFNGIPSDKFDPDIASKNQHKIFKELKTNANKQVCYADLTFNTTQGVCTVKSIVNGTVQ